MLYMETIHHCETKENSKVKPRTPNWKLYITMQLVKREREKKSETNLENH